LNADGLQVRIKATARAIVSVRNIITELRPFAADSTTFCHKFLKTSDALFRKARKALVVNDSQLTRASAKRKVIANRFEGRQAEGSASTPASIVYLKEQKAKVHRVNKQTFVIITVALVALLVSACNRSGSGATGGGGESGVAATVNGKNIMLSEVDKLLSQQAQGQQANLTPMQLAQARMQVLTGLVQKEVLLQRAEKEKLVPSDEEINRFINDLKATSNMTEEQFQKRLKEQDQTMETLREEARKSVAIQKLQDKTFGTIQITDKEVEDYYNNNKQLFVNARGVQLAMIAVDPIDNGAPDDAKSEADAKLKIDNIYSQLKTGADFADVARARSEDQSNAKGGDIGFATEADLKQNNFPPQLVADFFNTMQVGSFTSPIQFNGRWYVFKLQRKQLQNENLTLDSPGVREQITEALRNQRKQLLNTALLEVAMNDAKITNYLAANMLNSPVNYGAARPAQPPGSTATPAANTNNTAPAATPAASASPQPSAQAPATKPTAQK
jgi:peptidyl-prolyl cis-trans isomerase SurA